MAADGPLRDEWAESASSFALAAWRSRRIFTPGGDGDDQADNQDGSGDAEKNQAMAS